jgi:hypothetical protein
MRVYRFDNHGGLDGLHIHDEPVPSPQRAELLLRITAVLLNYRDIAIPLGRHPGHHERASRHDAAPYAKVIRRWVEPSSSCGRPTFRISHRCHK